MLISQAYAQVAGAAAAAPSATEAMVSNIALLVILVALFYLLLIRPQQKRFKEHANMLSALKKGDKVITGGGLVGKIEKITEGEDEVVIDLGGSVKVSALRSTISAKNDARLNSKPANDDSGKGTKAKKKK